MAFCGGCAPVRPGATCRRNTAIGTRSIDAFGAGARRVSGRAWRPLSRRPWPRADITTTAPRSVPTSRRRAEKGGSSTSSWPLAGRVHQYNSLSRRRQRPAHRLRAHARSSGRLQGPPDTDRLTCRGSKGPDCRQSLRFRCHSRRFEVAAHQARHSTNARSQANNQIRQMPLPPTQLHRAHDRPPQSQSRHRHAVRPTPRQLHGNAIHRNRALLDQICPRDLVPVCGPMSRI